MLLWSAQNTANYSCKPSNHNLHWAQWAYKPRRKLGDLVIAYNSTDFNLHDSFSNIGLFTSCRFFASVSKRVSVQKHSFENQNCVPQPVSFHFMLIALIFIWKVFSEVLFWDREAQDNIVYIKTQGWHFNTFSLVSCGECYRISIFFSLWAAQYASW